MPGAWDFHSSFTYLFRNRACIELCAASGTNAVWPPASNSVRGPGITVWQQRVRRLAKRVPQIVSINSFGLEATEAFLNSSRRVGFQGVSFQGWFEVDFTSMLLRNWTPYLNLFTNRPNPCRGWQVNTLFKSLRLRPPTPEAYWQDCRFRDTMHTRQFAAI